MKKDKTEFTRQRKQSVDEHQNKSVITDHAVKESHVIGWDEASILDREGNRSARWIRESIEIRKQDIQGHTMNSDVSCHISTTHFSPQQRHLGEKIGTGSHFDKGNRCCRNVSNKQERLDLDLIILIMSDNKPISLFKNEKGWYYLGAHRSYATVLRNTQILLHNKIATAKAYYKKN